MSEYYLDTILNHSDDDVPGIVHTVLISCNFLALSGANLQLFGAVEGYEVIRDQNRRRRTGQV